MLGLSPIMLGLNPGLNVDDVFATTLFTTESDQSNYSIAPCAVSPELLWSKCRTASGSNFLVDVVRGNNKAIYTDTSQVQFEYTGDFANPKTKSFSKSGPVNSANVAWAFRRAPKFFDIVSYTGNGAANRRLTHALGIKPGMIIIKSLSKANQWAVHHVSLGTGPGLLLNSSSASINASGNWVSATDDTGFSVGTDTVVNESGVTYIAYLFADDPSSSGIIRCGQWTSPGDINLGWAPQFILFKRSSGSGNWWILDTKRGWGANNDNFLIPNSNGVEGADANFGQPTSTGFTATETQTNVFMAIRRGTL